MNEMKESGGGPLRLRAVSLTHLHQQDKLLCGSSASAAGTVAEMAEDVLARRRNLERWIEFGVDPSKYISAASPRESLRPQEVYTSTAPTAAPEPRAVSLAPPVLRHQPASSAATSWLMEEDLYGTLCTEGPALLKASAEPTTTPPVAEHPPASMSAVRQNLLEWSTRVREAKEQDRCCAPKPTRRIPPHHAGGHPKKSAANAEALKGKESGSNPQAAAKRRRTETKGVSHAASLRRRTAPPATAPGNDSTSAPPPPPRTLLVLQSPSAETENAIVIAYQRLENTASLLEDIETALHDPNRIQAPPLFVGILMKAAAKMCSNTSLSESSSGKSYFPSELPPSRSHDYVEDVVIRWKEVMYVMNATRLGFAFLTYILEVLAGVELISFNAPATLLPLLSSTHGQLFTHCISDVRLMAWMLSLTDAAGQDTPISAYSELLRAHSILPPSSSICATDSLQRLVTETYYLSPLYRALYGQLGAKGLLQAFLRQEKRVSLLISVMKYNGIRVDLREVRQFRAKCQASMTEWVSRARAVVPQRPDFNIQSPDQCREVLYDMLQLGRHLPAGDNGMVTKTGRFSTAENTLRLLAEHHEFPQYIINYRKAAKLLQTYADGMMSHAFPVKDNSSGDIFVDSAFSVANDGKDGDAGSNGPSPQANLDTSAYAYLYSNFLQEGTDTGRLSCVEPNLQNLPRGSTPFDLDDCDPEHTTFRRCFIAEEGQVLVSVDYQQIELRVLAHLCADIALVDTLTGTTDIHRAIAQVIFKRNAVTAEERGMAKRVVFGALYGAGPRLLAAQMGVTVERALHVSGLLKSAFPQITAYTERLLQQSRADGYVRTISGRIRFLPDINSSVMANRMSAERQAFNTVVQGSAADIMKMAMLAVERDVLKPFHGEVMLLLQIHDEIVVSVKKEKVSQVIPKLTAAMTHAMSLIVPLCVTAKFGPSLGTLQEWTIEHELQVVSEVSRS